MRVTAKDDKKKYIKQTQQDRIKSWSMSRQQNEQSKENRARKYKGNLAMESDLIQIKKSNKENKRTNN